MEKDNSTIYSKISYFIIWRKWGGREKATVSSRSPSALLSECLWKPKIGLAEARRRGLSLYLHTDSRSASTWHIISGLLLDTRRNNEWSWDWDPSNSEWVACVPETSELPPPHKLSILFVRTFKSLHTFDTHHIYYIYIYMQIHVDTGKGGKMHTFIFCLFSAKWI